MCASCNRQLVIHRPLLFFFFYPALHALFIGYYLLSRSSQRTSANHATTTSPSSLPLLFSRSPLGVLTDTKIGVACTLLEGKKLCEPKPGLQYRDHHDHPLPAVLFCPYDLPTVVVVGQADAATCRSSLPLYAVLCASNSLPKEKILVHALPQRSS